MSLSERLGAVLALIPAARDEVRVTAKGAHAAATVEFYGAAAALLRSEDGPALVAAARDAERYRWIRNSANRRIADELWEHIGCAEFDRLVDHYAALANKDQQP